MAHASAGFARVGPSRPSYPARREPRRSAASIFHQEFGDSHFFGRGESECASTAQANSSFVLESTEFMDMFLPVEGTCPRDTTNVYRVFSNRPGKDNHRYTTDKAVRDQMVDKGWLIEGDGPDAVVMCGPQ